MEFGQFFPPMLLEEIEEPFNSSFFLFELKFDGIRAVIHVGPKTFKIFSRNGREITKLYPELKNIQKECKQNIIFDGEIVLFWNGLPNFSKLQERMHTKNKKRIEYFSKEMPVCFMAFDCLYENEKPLVDEPLTKRKKILQKFLDTDYFIKVNYIENTGKKLFESVKKMDFEGIVAKRKDSLYEINTRTENWLKIKNLKKETFYIGGYIEKQENAVVSLLLGEFQNKDFHFVGKVTMGKKQPMYQKLKKEPIKKTSPFCDYKDKDKECRFINPHLSCEIWYLERTIENKLRQPVFKK